MSFKALLYAYILGGVTFIPLVFFGVVYFTVYTSIPVGEANVSKNAREKLEKDDWPEEDYAPDVRRVYW
jgi:hypothetical protein